MDTFTSTTTTQAAPMSSMLGIDMDAVHLIASLVEREWGSDGYVLGAIEGFDWRSGIAKIRCIVDGAEFYVGSTRWGNTVHGETREQVMRLLLPKIREDERP